ncbi:MAG: DUF2851 family protein [Luteolibacter sp.]
MNYGFLLESVWHPPLAFADAPATALPSELELQALWFSGALGRQFRTVDGRKVSVTQFGEWNRGAGPDFSHCVIELDGTSFHGCIELDTASSDWENHGHGANPNFASVILHVVFRPSGHRTFIRTSDHREIPQVVISEDLLDTALNRPNRETAIAHPGRCLAPLKQLPGVAIERLLADAARHRANRKAARLLGMADAHGRDAALFQATAETLGYRANTLAMRLLSQRVRFSSLTREIAEPVIFGSAGFLSPKLHERTPEDSKAYLRELWDEWWKLRDRYELPPERAISWKNSGQRPANHPHRRLGALVALVNHWTRYRKLALARPFAAKPLLEFLQQLEHPFWSHRYTLTSERAPRKIALFGKSQALELLANHLVPLALHEDGCSFESYLRLGGPTMNEKVKRCSLRLFGSLEVAKPWLRKIAHQQALLQIYQDFCLEDCSSCRDCPFPEQLAQWR